MMVIMIKTTMTIIMKIIIIIDKKKKTIKIFLRPTIIMTLTPTHGFTELQNCLIDYLLSKLINIPWTLISLLTQR